MEYSVYSFGGAEILWKVFNGVAIVFQSSYFQTMGVLMIGIALLVVAARAIPSASFPILFKHWIVPTFLLMAFFWGPKVSLHLIDKVDPDFKYSKVDNVPLGLAMAASFSSQVSEFLTTTIETIFTTSDMEQFSKVGPMFGARLIHEAQTLTIRDPLIRENLKDFTRQCFAWPYIFSNLEPGKKAAMETEDMLGFIEANPHPLLGIYWRKGFGESEFINCRQCTAKVREIIPLEVEMGFEALARKLFDTTSRGEPQTRRLKQYFGDAWQFLAKGSSDASKVIQQELMLNSYRAALQDKREELGLGRNSAQMIYLNAERGQAHQDSSFLIKAALSGSQIPILHTIMFAIALMFFTVIAPFTFISGGIKLIMTWGKVMAWLATWPPLFAVLNAIGYMYAAKSTTAHLIGYGEGLNLMTQNGLADSAYTAYCFVMGLQYSVPFVSWALISSGGGYALSQLSSFLTQSGEAFASKASSEVVDGNVSFDSQTLHHRSVANSQLAQQQVGPSFNYGSRFDDGKLATLYGPRGQATFQEHQTQMGTNISQNDALSSMLAIQGQMALNSSLSDTKSAGTQTQMGINETVSLMNILSNSKGFTETFGENSNSNVQKSFSDMMDQVKQFATAHHVSDETAFTMMLNAGVDGGASFGSGLPGKVAAGIKASLTGQYQLSAKDSESMSKNINTSEAKKFATNFSQGMQFLEDNRGSISDSLTRQKMDQIQDHFNKSDTYSEQAAANLQQSKMWSETASQQRQKGVSSSSNLNEVALRRKADRDFGGDIGAAAQWASQNPEIYQREVSQYIDSNQSSMKPKELYSKDDIYQHSEESSRQVADAPLQNIHVQKTRLNSNKESMELEKNLDEERKKTQLTKSFINAAASGNQNSKQNFEEKERDFEEESNKWNITRAFNKVLK